MGTVGIKIVGMDVKELIKRLNKALADEWLAYYQYWVEQDCKRTNEARGRG